MRRKKGATLIELIIVIIVLGIIAGTGSGLIVYFTQLFVYSPRQLDTQKIGQELENIMIEGNVSVRGMRYARLIIDASAAQFTYSYGYPASTDGLYVRLRWDPASQHIFQSTSDDEGVSWSTEALIPGYISSDTAVDGKVAAGQIFTYKKDNDANWVSGIDALTEIRRVIISINVKTGTGNFQGDQGFSNITASVEIKNYQ